MTKLDRVRLNQHFDDIEAALMGLESLGESIAGYWYHRKHEARADRAIYWIKDLSKALTLLQAAREEVEEILDPQQGQ